MYVDLAIKDSIQTTKWMLPLYLSGAFAPPRLTMVHIDWWEVERPLLYYPNIFNPTSGYLLRPPSPVHLGL